MAKEIAQAPNKAESPPAERRRNPFELFGEGLRPSAEFGLGIFSAAFINDKLVAPAVAGVAGGLGGGSPLMARAVDGLTTAASGWAAGEVVRMLGQHELGKSMAHGGVTFGLIKLLASPIEGLSLSANIPSRLGLAQYAPKPVKGAPALPAGQRAALPAPAPAGAATSVAGRSFGI